LKECLISHLAIGCSNKAFSWLRLPLRPLFHVAGIKWSRAWHRTSVAEQILRAWVQPMTQASSQGRNQCQYKTTYNQLLQSMSHEPCALD
jgi:hypothetical protein